MKTGKLSIKKINRNVFELFISKKFYEDSVKRFNKIRTGELL